MKRLLWLPVAGFMLIGGAAVAAAGSPLIEILPATTPAASESEEVESGRLEFRPESLLDDVLTDLVSRDVITQAQADAIVSGLRDAAEQERADAEARLEEMRQTWEQVQSFLEDGVINQSEVDQLPADNPLREAFDSIANDGQITLEQLRELGPRVGAGVDGPGFGGHGRHHLGPRGDSDGFGVWHEPNESSEPGTDS